MYSMPRHIYSNLIYACWFVFCIPNVDVFRQCSLALMIPIRLPRRRKCATKRAWKCSLNDSLFFIIVIFFFCFSAFCFVISVLTPSCSQLNVFHLYKCCIRFYSFPWIINLNHLVPYRESLKPSCVWIFRLLGFFARCKRDSERCLRRFVGCVRHFLRHPTTLSNSKHEICFYFEYLPFFYVDTVVSLWIHRCHFSTNYFRLQWKSWRIHLMAKKKANVKTNKVIV